MIGVTDSGAMIWYDIRCKNCDHAEFEHYQKGEYNRSGDPRIRPCKCCPCEGLDPFVSRRGII